MKNKNQVVLPIDLGIKISDNDPVRKLIEICEELDYTKLFETYVRKWKKVNPITLFELLVFGYMTRRFSSRNIEEACRTDIRFMWILQDEPVPDHSTISRFQSRRLIPVIESLFYQVIEKLIEIGEVSYKNVFIDGTKIEADANRYTFVWAKAVEKLLNKLNARIENELPPIAENYGIRTDVSLEECLETLQSIAKMNNVKFVSGKGKHKIQLQRDIEKLSDFVSRKQNYIENTMKFNGRKSFSKTDTDATFMRMKEDHMLNGQLKPGYNVQIAVESEYIVGMSLFPNPTDVNTLIPFLKRVQSRSEHKIEQVVADAGYESEENYSYLKEIGIKPFIKPQDYEQGKKRSYKNNIYHINNMAYDRESDFLTCPNGKKLVFVYEKTRKSGSGYVVNKKVYQCENCFGCPHREKCFKGVYENRRVEISHDFTQHRKESYDNITSAEGILLRMNRSIQVEGVFGVLKQDYGFRRFLMRGKQKNETQFFLLAMAFNIQKLCNRIADNRFGTSLFEKRIA